jgi:hypothetical protein
LETGFLVARVTLYYASINNAGAHRLIVAQKVPVFLDSQEELVTDANRGKVSPCAANDLSALGMPNFLYFGNITPTEEPRCVRDPCEPGIIAGGKHIMMRHNTPFFALFPLSTKLALQRGARLT